MLTMVFLCQPIGQLAATLVALIAVARQREGIGNAAFQEPGGPTRCNAICIQTLDSIWRWIIGIGVIPAVIALWFRITIIESPRYTADVSGDSRKAASELARYLPPDSIRSVSTTSVLSERRSFNRRDSNASAGSANASLNNLSRQSSQVVSVDDARVEEGQDEDEEEIKFRPPPLPSWTDFKDYFWHKGNLRTLLATSLCWFCVDL